MSQANRTILKDVSAPVAPVRALDVKITDKGGLSVYGLQRFPVTLYREQWEALLANKDKLIAFMSANSDKLATKNEARAPLDGRTRL